MSLLLKMFVILCAHTKKRCYKPSKFFEHRRFQTNVPKFQTSNNIGHCHFACRHGCLLFLDFHVYPKGFSLLAMFTHTIRGWVEPFCFFSSVRKCLGYILYVELRMNVKLVVICCHLTVTWTGFAGATFGCFLTTALYIKWTCMHVYKSNERTVYTWNDPAWIFARWHQIANLKVQIFGNIQGSAAS